jgi:hypothetical protein
MARFEGEQRRTEVQRSLHTNAPQERILHGLHAYAAYRQFNKLQISTSFDDVGLDCDQTRLDAV